MASLWNRFNIFEQAKAIPWYLGSQLRKAKEANPWLGQMDIIPGKTPVYQYLMGTAQAAAPQRGGASGSWERPTVLGATGSLIH